MRLIVSTAVMAALLATGNARAADLGPYSNSGGQRPHAASHAIDPAHRHFYVRGDVGIARHGFGSFSQQDLADNGGTFLSKSIGDAPLIAMGFGWQINRLRFDLTGEYRASARVKALDNLSTALVGPDGTLVANTEYDGNMSAIVGLINGYYDLGKWRGMTPYVGAGIGFSRTRMSGLTTLSTATFTDAATGASTTQISPGYSQDKTQANLAWALMAGVSFDLANHAKLDFGYRYLNLGSNVAASSGVLNCVCGTVGQPLKIGNLDSHEIRVGLRVPLNLGHETAAPHPLK